MGKEYDNTNSGILSRNKRQRNDRDPTHQGSINVEGKEYWISAWVNTGREGTKLAGEKYFSLKLNPKEAPTHTGERAPAKPAAAPAAQPQATFDDDDIPF